jgi:RNA methyltransferase, TrmH family
MKNYKEITSSENAQFKSWKDLLNSKGIKKQKKALIQGKSIVHEYFKSFFDHDIEILFTKNHGVPANLGPKTKSFLLDSQLFDQLNITGVDYPMLSVPTPEITSYDSNSNGLQVFLPLGDPKNLGAALRNCLAFGASSVILLQEASNPFHPQAIKASSGACFHLNLFKGPSILDLQDKNIFCLDSNGTPLQKVKWPKDPKILVGEEGQGLPASLKEKNQIVSIETSNKIESLNANQALGIVLYECFSKN